MAPSARRLTAWTPSPNSASTPSKSCRSAISPAAASRGAFTIAEDERNEAKIVSPAPNGWGLDGVWADDFHHCIRVALTGDRHGYFAAYTGDAAELADILRHGWLYRGQVFPPS